VIASDQTDVLYRSGEGTERYKGGIVSPGTFEFFGMSALVGRVMQPADYEPGAPPVFVFALQSVGQGVRRRSGNLEQDVCVEWDIENTNRNYAAAVWMGRRRHVDSGEADSGGDRKSHRGAFQQRWFLLGHLKPGISVKQAEADFTVVAKNLATVYPAEYPKRFTVFMDSLTNLVVGRFKTTLYIVLAAVGLLLLIGCGNVANLLLARATTREKEFAIRSALGASRWRLIRQLLVESLLLAIGGAAMGTLLAWEG